MKAADWIAPGVAIAVIGLGLTFFNSRFTSIDGQYVDTGKRLTEIDTKLDRRADALLQSIRETNSRIDVILQQQTTLASQVGRVEGELGYVRNRLDKVADKLQVSDAGQQVPVAGPQSAPTLASAGKPGDLSHPQRTVEDGLLTKDQFERLYSDIKSQHEPAYTSQALAVGEKVPASTPVKPLPLSVEKIRPSWASLAYTVGKTGIAIIDPTDKSVLALVTFSPDSKKP